MLTKKSVSFAPSSRGPKPLTGYLFPPSAYCPHDCEWCPLPCKLSRYHVGPHYCGGRHSARGSRFAALLSSLALCKVSALVPPSLAIQLGDFFRSLPSGAGPCSFR